MLEEQVESGVFFRGRLTVNELHAQEEATVSTSSPYGTILISGSGDRNRAGWSISANNTEQRIN